MSSQLQRITSNTIIRRYPPPAETSLTSPHTKFVYGKPSKHQNEYHLKFDCHETGKTNFWGSIENKFIGDTTIHDFLMNNHTILGSSFSKHWKKETKCFIPNRNDILYDYEDRCIFYVDSVQNLAQTSFVHACHRDRLIIITANKIAISDTFSECDDIVVEGKEYILNPSYINFIGTLDDENIKNKIGKHELFASGDDRMYRILSKKLVSVPKPTKRARKIGVSDDYATKHWYYYVSIHLQQNNIPFAEARSVVKFKLRTKQFEEVWPFIFIKNENQFKEAYLDYFSFQLSLRTGRIALKCVFLRKDKISGLIEGEDLIPNDF